MDFQNFAAGINDHDKRIDKLLRFLMPEVSLSEIYKLIRKKMIKVNGKKTTENYRIKKDDVISIPAFFLLTEKNENNQSKTENQNKQTKNSYIKLDIVFENEHILILNKPYNVNVHGGENSLEKTVRRYYQQKKNDNSLTFKAGPLHRLDKKTTGLIAFSMSLQGARWFSRNIQNHKIQKIYYAVLDGKLGKKDETVFWSDFVENSREKNGSFFTVTAARNNFYGAQNAELEIMPLLFGEMNGRPVTFAKIILKTGRKHQIRAQCALHNFPLSGDKTYGSKSFVPKNFNQDFFLQAAELNFPQNDFGIPSSIKIPLNKDFENLLNFVNHKTKN